MGIVNITPDSFSDGGRFFDTDSAVERCFKLINDGAEIVDLGAESSRPGAIEIDIDEEWRRLNPVLNSLSKKNFPGKISIDSCKKEIVKRCVNEYKIDFINNILGIFEFDFLKELARSSQLNYIGMHIHERPQTMQKNPLDGWAAVDNVLKFFEKSELELKNAGFSQERIFLDPGIGFGKTDKANLMLLAMTGAFSKRYNLVLGISRKSFLGRLLGIETPEERDPASKMLELGLIISGAKIIRTHEVGCLSKIRSLLKEPRKYIL